MNNQKVLAALPAVVALLLAANAHAITIHVDVGNCPGPGNGTESDPYCSIQTAIVNAVDADEIVVAPGIYFETIDFLGKAITLVSAAGPSHTTIDGEGGGSVVICNSGEGSGTVLDGFTITGGRSLNGAGMQIVDSSPTVTNCTFRENTVEADGAGAGIYNENSHPAVTHCTFEANATLAGGRGGGMYNHTSHPTLTHCTFVANTTFAGTGMAMYNDESSPTLAHCTFADHVGGPSCVFNNASSPTITDCLFIGNEENALSNFDGSDAIVTNCTFIGGPVYRSRGMRNQNSSPIVTDCEFSGFWGHANSGAMINSSVGSPFIANCTFFDNSTGSYGGAIYHATDLPSTILNCTFADNTALYGGAIYAFQHAPVLVSGCLFDGNAAGQSAGALGISSPGAVVTDCTFAGNLAGAVPALGRGGAIAIWSTGNASITNCVFEENTAETGGGIRTGNAAHVAVANCSFDGNTAHGRGAGIYHGSEGVLTVTNCTLSDNSAVFGGGGLDSAADGAAMTTNCIFWNNEPAEIVGDVAVNYCNVRGGAPAPGDGNIDADPQFADPGNGNLRLLPGSPCIDAGDNTAVPDDVTTDLDGLPRFLEIPETPDTGYGDPPIVDMGAYESLGGGCLAITNIETICHGDGSTFTVNVEGLNACTGGTTMATFTGSGGAVGEDLCATLLINTEQGGFCCSTQVCVPVPDCSPSPPPCPWDCGQSPDGSIGVVDFLALLAQWGQIGVPCDFDGDGVSVTDFLDLLAAWGVCP